MPIQSYRHWNLARLLSQLEQMGHVTAEAQAHALGDIVTPGKLTRMVLSCPVPSMFARALEHAWGKRKGWLDEPHPVHDDYAWVAMSPGPSTPHPSLSNRDKGRVSPTLEQQNWQPW